MTERPQPVHLRLVNGWTLSICEDLSGIGYSVAAFPSCDPEIQHAEDRRWFQFQRTGADRCHGIDDVMAAAREVAAASPPAAYRGSAA